MNRLFLLVAIVAIVSAEPLFTQDTQWFNEQRLDHFDPLNFQIWSQRFYVIQDYFKPETGPVFLYICGESTCKGLKPGKAYLAEMAQQLGGLVLSLEHRYYGSSWPLGDQSMTDENLRFLSVEQAMGDLAYFSQYIIDNQMFGVTKQTPWITVGGSYAGAVSSWYRMKYPHMTIGAIGSSGVVNAIYNFPNFDKQIKLSTLKSSQACAQKISSANQYVQSKVNISDTTERKKFQARFGDNATSLNWKEFLFYFADIFVEQVQYGNRTNLCKVIEGLADDEAVVQWAIDQQADPTTYSEHFLSKPVVLNNTETGRSWQYQICTEFGWFQTAPKDADIPMRGTQLDIKTYFEQCMGSFPDIDDLLIDQGNRSNIINQRYGGLNISANHLIMTNGNEDPWQWASKTTGGRGIANFMIQGDDIGHCQDLHSSNIEQDPEDLKNVRLKELQMISNWIDEHWKNQPSQTDAGQNAKQEVSFVQQKLLSEH